MAKAKMTGLGKGLDVLFGGAPLEMQTLEEENTQPEETADSKNLKTLRTVSYTHLTLPTRSDV